MAELFANNATSTLAAGIGSGDGTLTVASGEGARFPAITSPDYFYATLTQAGATETSWEVVKVTARASDTFTITRAQQGTSAAAWASGDKVELRLTKTAADRLGANQAFENGVRFSAIGSDPTIASTEVGLFSRSIAGRLAMVTKETAGINYITGWPAVDLFPATVFPNPGAATFNATGDSFATLGTNALYQPTVGSYALETPATQQTASATTNAGGAGYRNVSNQRGLFRSTTTGRGGFYGFARVVFVTFSGAATGHRLFIGFSTGNQMNAANGATEPSAIGSHIGFGCDDTDANVTIMTRDGATSTKTALSTPLAKTSLAVANRMFDFHVTCLPGGACHFRLVQWDTYTATVLHDGAVSATLPATGTLVAANMAIGSGDSGSAPVWRVCAMGWESLQRPF